MKSDGYVKFIVHPNGEKGLLVEHQANDWNLDMYFGEFADQNIDSVISLNEAMAKNANMKDCLVVATFHYQSSSSFNGETTEWEDVITVVDVMVVCTDYKDQWRKNLTPIYKSLHAERKLIDIEEEDGREISEWEEFYEEDFVPWVKPKPVIFDTKDFFQAIQQS